MTKDKNLAMVNKFIIYLNNKDNLSWPTQKTIVQSSTFSIKTEP